MPFSPEERDAAFKRMAERYGYDINGNKQPTEGIEPTPLPTAQTKLLVKAMTPEGDIIDIDPEEAKKKGYYVLPPTK